MTQIIPITSEALQATIRRLLPSQRGFGEDLQASNLITPIIDLTPTAEGSSVPVQLQEAFFSTQTDVELLGAGTTTAISTTGFWRVNYQLTSRNGGSADRTALRLNDGASTISLVKINEQVNPQGYVLQGNLTVFLTAGESLELFSDVATSYIHITARQIATVTGVLVNPTGFTPE
jgi:hypothetical protein